MSIDFPPDDLTLSVRRWLAEEIYPGLLGETFDDRAAAVWLDGSNGFVSLWVNGYGRNLPPLERVEYCKQELYRRIDAIAHPPVPGAGVSRPLIGRLRVEHKLFRDDTGYRRVLFCSWFPALRILRDNPAEFERQINAIVAAGYQGIRVFLAVGGWSDYWDGREVAPITFTKWFYTGNLQRSDRLGAKIDAWDDYDDLLRKLLRACKSRGLRLHVTCGDMQIIAPSAAQELDLHRRLARICAEEGGAEVVALAEVTNEYPINRMGGDAPESIAQMGRVIAVWRELCPGVLTAQGAPLSEEVEKLEAAATYGDVCAVHITRDPFAMCLKRTFGCINWEGAWRHFSLPFWAGEPAGPGQDSFAALNDPASLTALHFMHAALGYATNWFQGAAVRARQPLESEWGFTEMPRLLSVLPEDVATWEHVSDGRGGIMYFVKGNQFVTATMRDWRNAPPRPVASWRLYRGTDVIDGTGNPPDGITGGLMGTFQE